MRNGAIDLSQAGAELKFKIDPATGVWVGTVQYIQDVGWVCRHKYVLTHLIMHGMLDITM